MCAFSFRECNHTRTEREHLASTVLATHSLHQQLLQRKWQTREGYPASDLTWVLVSVTLFSCKQQAVTLVFKAPHHFWWAVSKQKQGSAPEPKRTQVVLRWHACARTHAQFASIMSLYLWLSPTPSPLWNPVLCTVTPAHAVCHVVKIRWSTAQFLSLSFCGY